MQLELPLDKEFISGCICKVNITLPRLAFSFKGKVAAGNGWMIRTRVCALWQECVLIRRLNDHRWIARLLKKDSLGGHGTLILIEAHEIKEK